MRLCRHIFFFNQNDIQIWLINSLQEHKKANIHKWLEIQITMSLWRTLFDTRCFPRLLHQRIFPLTWYKFVEEWDRCKSYLNTFMLTSIVAFLTTIFHIIPYFCLNNIIDMLQEILYILKRNFSIYLLYFISRKKSIIE